MGLSYESDAKSAASNRATTEFDSIREALSACSILVERVEALTDKLLGPAPNPPAAMLAGTAPAPAPAGALPRIGAEALHTAHRVREAFASLDRIERALP